MFCPKCSQSISDNGTQFCSKCGFLTKNIEDFVKNGGEIGYKRQKGIKQGVKLILLSLILLPVLILLIPMFPPNDILVESSPSNTWFEQIGWAIIWTTFLAGIARIVFALYFETKTAPQNIEEKITNQINESKINNALPPMEEIPISDKICFAAEVGLGGELRAVNRIEQRISEAEKLGFEEIYVSKFNQKATPSRRKIKIHELSKLNDVFQALFG